MSLWAGTGMVEVVISGLGSRIDSDQYKERDTQYPGPILH